MTGRIIPKGKRDKDEGPLLVDDEDFKKHPAVHKAYIRAKSEGRVDGQYKCPVCGMRFFNEQEANDCCWTKED